MCFRSQICTFITTEDTNSSRVVADLEWLYISITKHSYITPHFSFDFSEALEEYMI